MCVCCALMPILLLEHELDRVKAEIRDKQMRSLILRAYNQACTQETLRLRAYHELLWGLDDANSKQEALSGDRVDQLCRQLQETLLTRRVERIPHDLISQDPAGLVDMITSQIIAQPLLGPPPPPLSSAPQRKKLDTVSLFFNNTDDGREALDHGEAKYDETLKRVRDRVCQVYSDARIQTAVFECIQAKAECLGSVAELEVLKQVADEWQVLEANHGVKRDGDDTTSLRTLVDSVAQKQRRVYQLMASNRLFPQRIEKQRQQLEEYAGHQGELTDKLAELCHALVGTVREHLDAFHRTPLAPDSVNIAPRPTDGTRLGQIKDALHPYLELSREGVLQSLTETLTRGTYLFQLGVGVGTVFITVSEVICNSECFGSFKAT
ncbi:hypothetical protein BX666DRAFT_780880 [Dichotomocladium elegans]|nr:hypothetical protein BX666DRAFT_780880 [Dichotomocladium elegans]